MDHMTIHNRKYYYEKNCDDMDVLTYYDEDCRKLVKLKFPSTSRLFVADQIIDVLSDALISEILSIDD